MTLRTHRLTLTEFDELAAGRGASTGELRSAQLSKRTLQILAILRETSRRFPGSFVGSQLVDSYTKLAAARRQSKSAVDAVLLHPLVGAWAGYTLRLLVRPGGACTELDDELGHLGGIAAAAALAAGTGFDLILRIRADGTLMLPTFGLVKPGPSSRWCRARYRADGTSLELELDGSTTQIPIDSPDEGPTWFRLRRLTSTTAGCRIDVELNDIDPFRDSHRLGALARLSAAEVACWQASLDEAWALLVRQQCTLAEALSSGISTLIPLAPNDRIIELGHKAGVSATISDACGAIALTQPPGGTALAATLVHEFQHSKLSALLDLVSLLRAGTDTLFYAPWRSDPRPLRGLAHGAYAYLALVNFWHALRQAENEAARRVAHFEFARWRRALRHVLRTIDGSGLLTVQGDRFISHMRKQLASLHPTSGPTTSEFLAKYALIDHWLNWRMHNLHPNTEWVVAAAHAWLASGPCPSVPPHPKIGNGGALPGNISNARLELTYRLLEEPRLFAAERNWMAAVPTAIVADASLIGGDTATAARLYREAVVHGPERTDWWAGLALANHRLGTTAGRVLTAHPEYLSGLFRHLLLVTGGAPDIDGLTAWFAGCTA